MMSSGTNGSQLWDTAFIVQAMVESGLSEEPQNHESMIRALEFLEDCQIRRDPPDRERCYRHFSKGAWPFSTRDQSYTVSDCTAEGLKSTIMLQSLSYTPRLVSDERLFDAVDVILTMQNEDGGWASYEPTRSPKWLEWINPAEVFGNIMVEYSYTECTGSVLLGLAHFTKVYPEYRAEEIRLRTQRAIKFIIGQQREDGSWYGSWGICFTYAMFFAIETLASVGLDYFNSESQRKACQFLVSKQQEDGGWGETYKSCETGVWCQHPKTQVVQTAWAILALMAAKYPDEECIRKGIKVCDGLVLTSI